ncbi:MAG: phosphoribosylformylglycinamidine synthase subunit PurS [Cytophagales bacterium]
MKFIAEIDVMPLKEILDPQGKAVLLGLGNLGINTALDVRIGKHIVITLDTNSLAEAENDVEMACKKLLANMIMESYSFKISNL